LAWVLVVLLFLGSVAAAVHNPSGPQRTTALAAADSVAHVERPRSFQPGQSDCAGVLITLGSRSAARTVDIGPLVASGTIAPLPVPGDERPTVTKLDEFSDAGDYVADTRTVAPSVWLQAMEEHGFVSSTKSWYNGTAYGAEVLRFRSPAGAAAFHRVTSEAICRSGLMYEARPLASLAGGFSYEYALQGASPYRASFLAGDSVVNLRICECVEAPDDHALVEQWAEAVARQVGAL
jgi:hypothetical protein